VKRVFPWVVTVAFTLVLFAASLWLGEVNQDEGWYLYAGRLAAEGELPFIDFATTQGPVMSLAYAAAWPLVRAWGVAGGRLFTAALGLLTAALAGVLAWRRSGKEFRACAAFLAFAFIGLNLYQAYFFSIVKTYSLSALLLAAGFLALTFLEGRGRKVAAALAGVLLALAAGVRLSAGFAAPVVWVWLLRRRRQGGAAWVFLGAAALTGAAVFLPFLILAPEATWFGLVEYHAGREVGGAARALAYKGGFLARLVHAYFVPLAALAVALAVRPRAVHATRPALPLWSTVIVISAVHFLAPFPYDDYQVMVFPLFAVALGTLLAGLPAFRLPHAALVVLLSLAAAFSSPRLQSWLVTRDRIWWPLRTQTPLGRLREAGALVRALSGEDDLLLTQDTYLAVEADRRVPRGLELGPFSYFPEWERARAARCHVLNREMLRALIATTPAPVAAFSGYGLSIRSPSVTALSPAEQAALNALVQSRYTLYTTIPRFGQAETPLRVLVARDQIPGGGEGQILNP